MKLAVQYNDGKTIIYDNMVEWFTAKDKILWIKQRVIRKTKFSVFTEKEIPLANVRWFGQYPTMSIMEEVKRSEEFIMMREGRE